MSDSQGPVSDEELQAYVDQRVDARRRAVIEAYLREHPDLAEKVAAYQRQRALLRDLVSPIAAEPVPPRLQLDRIFSDHRQLVWPLWRHAAVVILGLALGAAGGWYLHALIHPVRATTGIASLQREAVADYAVYSEDARRPIEVAATDENGLNKWLSDRLHRTIVAPNLTGVGYRLMGGRLLATTQGQPAAFIMYDHPENGRLSVIIESMGAAADVRMTDIVKGPINGCSWITDGLGYAVVAAVAPKRLDQIAQRIIATGNASPR